MWRADVTYDTSIPQDLHTGARGDVKAALGSFWSDVFDDQELLDAVLAAKILSAAQLHIDTLENLSLRDHNGSPLFHREHWHPLVIRRSRRNSATGLVIGMPDTPSIGPQETSSDNQHPYVEGEVFEVGRNDAQSKVFTYPFTAFEGCPLAGVRTCLCDSISNPGHILMQGRDFAVDRGTLVIRRESDPFDVGGYRTVEVPGSYTDAATGKTQADSLVVLWLCDAEFDTNNVGDFLGYPMGIDAASTPVAKECLSALWDAVVYGLTPRCLNALLGAMFRVPTAQSNETVEKVDGIGPYTVVTDKNVYLLESGLPVVTAGQGLRKGDFLTNAIRVETGLSADEIEHLVGGVLATLSIPPGGVLGVKSTVVVQNNDDNPVSAGADWFRLNAADMADSPFWTAFRVRVPDLAARQAFVASLRIDGKINPMKALGYILMANTVLVRLNECELSDDPCARQVYRTFLGLIPAYASVLVLDESGSPYEPTALALGGIHGDVMELHEEDAVDYGLAAVSEFTETQTLAAEDDVAYTFVPRTGTEV